MWMSLNAQSKSAYNLFILLSRRKVLTMDKVCSSNAFLILKVWWEEIAKVLQKKAVLYMENGIWETSMRNMYM